MILIMMERRPEVVLAAWDFRLASEEDLGGETHDNMNYYYYYYYYDLCYYCYYDDYYY